MHFWCVSGLNADGILSSQPLGDAEKTRGRCILVRICIKINRPSNVWNAHNVYIIIPHLHIISTWITYINKYTNRHNENSIWQLCESWFLQLFYEHCFIFVLKYEMLVVPFLYYQAYFIIFYSAKNPGRNWLNFAHNNSRTNKINALELPELSLSFWTGVFVSYFHDSQSILVTLSLSNTFYHSYAYPFIHL